MVSNVKISDELLIKNDDVLTNAEAASAAVATAIVAATIP